CLLSRASSPVQSSLAWRSASSFTLLLRFRVCLFSSFSPPLPPRPTLFPYTTLFRSRPIRGHCLARSSTFARALFAKPCTMGSRKIGRALSELQSRSDLVCRLLLEKKKKQKPNHIYSPYSN